jgi:hypothetical protein
MLKYIILRKLVVYPRGSKNDDHLSIYVEIVDHEKLQSGNSYIANFSFSILDLNTKRKRITREGKQLTTQIKNWRESGCKEPNNNN